MIAVSEAITALGAARSSEMAIMNCPANFELPVQGSVRSFTHGLILVALSPMIRRLMAGVR